jgi:hypothetical protein
MRERLGRDAQLVGVAAPQEAAGGATRVQASSFGMVRVSRGGAL